MPISQRFPKSMAEFEERFSSEAACREYLFGVRWANGWRCPRCGVKQGWPNARRLIECRECGHQSSLTAGTVFHGTKRPLRLWFKAIFLMVTQKNGVSAKALQGFLGVSYPTAWTWLHKLRRAMGNRAHAPLSGIVEVDDAYWGGHRKGERGRRKGGGSKDLLLVAVEAKDRGAGRLRLARPPDHTGKSFTDAVRRHVLPGTRVRTDGLSSYAALSAGGYEHRPEVVGQNNGPPSGGAASERAQGDQPSQTMAVGHAPGRAAREAHRRLSGGIRVSFQPSHRATSKSPL